MKKLVLVVIASVCFVSCDVMQGAFAGMGGYGYVPTNGNVLWQNAPSWNSFTPHLWNNPGGTVVTGGGTVSSSSSSSSTTINGSSSSSSSGGRSFCTFCSNTKKCSTCRGTGKRTDNYFGTGQSATERCGVCGGSGKCPHCK